MVLNWRHNDATSCVGSWRASTKWHLGADSLWDYRIPFDIGLNALLVACPMRGHLGSKLSTVAKPAVSMVLAPLHLVYQEKLATVLDGVLICRCDMCVVGQLRHPETKLLIQKGNQVLTTSRIMAARIGELRSTHDHDILLGISTIEW